MKRDQLWWDRWFLGMAEYISTASKDPSTKLGAVIVNKNRKPRGWGYNGFPRGVKDSPDRYLDRDLKLQLVVHAERNAILNSKGSLKGCTMYVWPTLMIPNSCPVCCQEIIQSGVKRLVFYTGETAERWQKMAEVSYLLLYEAGIDICPITKE